MHADVAAIDKTILRHFPWELACKYVRRKKLLKRVCDMCEKDIPETNNFVFILRTGNKMSIKAEVCPKCAAKILKALGYDECKVAEALEYLNANRN